MEPGSGGAGSGCSGGCCGSCVAAASANRARCSRDADAERAWSATRAREVEAAPERCSPGTPATVRLRWTAPGRSPSKVRLRFGDPAAACRGVVRPEVEGTTSDTSKLSSSSSGPPGELGGLSDGRREGKDTRADGCRTNVGALMTEARFAYSKVLFESSKCSLPGCTLAIIETRQSEVRELLSNKVSLESRKGALRPVLGVWEASLSLFALRWLTRASMQFASASNDVLILAPSLRAAPVFCV
mmetsp:Transcript_78957/g.226279  ORF Transcript_78957/g.226279 Transcript_78957/m.226279 type:complete len:244 (+) Transcript_78957:371-1102(+)